MKRFIILFFALIVLFSVGCKSEKTDEKSNQDTVLIENKDTLADTSATNGLGKEFTSKYICPMHCKGSGSDTPGVCPVCGMEYVENPDYQ